jgi:hypothetical protein
VFVIQYSSLLKNCCNQAVATSIIKPEISNVRQPVGQAGTTKEEKQQINTYHVTSWQGLQVAGSASRGVALVITLGN